jgi:hypothetical protein
MGVSCLGLGACVGAILAVAGEWVAALAFPALLAPSGGLFLWLALRARRSLERDLAEGRVAVLEGTVQAKRSMQLPRGKAYALRVNDRDVFVGASTYEQLAPGDRIRVRRAVHSGVALGTERVDANGTASPLQRPGDASTPD